MNFLIDHDHFAEKRLYQVPSLKPAHWSFTWLCSLSQRSGGSKIDISHLTMTGKRISTGLGYSPKQTTHSCKQDHPCIHQDWFILLWPSLVLHPRTHHLYLAAPSITVITINVNNHNKPFQELRWQQLVSRGNRTICPQCNSLPTPLVMSELLIYDNDQYSMIWKVFGASQEGSHFDWGETIW